MNSSNLPIGSYDFIFIKCDDLENKQNINDLNACNTLKNLTMCTCNNLFEATKYKITFITRKNTFDDAIFENISNQYTSNKFLNRIKFYI